MPSLSRADQCLACRAAGPPLFPSGARAMPYALGRGAFRVTFLAAAMVSAFAVPDAARAVDELTVVGKPRTLPTTLSYSVSYADLDLRKREGQIILAKRID